jgi:acyl-CoA reductase-like NAD-dependent aldehyde dehydrogenase
MSGSRTYVQEGIYDEYAARTIEIAKKKKVGDPT